MSPSSFHNDHHAKPCSTNRNFNNGSLLPPCLKINKESHISKHVSSPAQFSVPSPPSSSSSSSPPVRMGPAKPAPHHQMRPQPVIIYTHAPKIIHTHPSDFMALVQKLTGLSQTEDDGRLSPPSNHKQEKPSVVESSREEKSNLVNDDNESSSVITEENSGSSNNNNVLGDGQVNSCFVPPMFDPTNPYMTNVPVFAPNSSSSADFLCTNHHQPFFGYTDSLPLGTPNNGRTSIPSASSFEGISDFREF